MVNRIVLLILDSVGIGALPDAKNFNSEGANTLGNLFEVHPDINLNHFLELGLGNIEGIDYLPEKKDPQAAYGRAMEYSNGKDTTTGHWEIAGIHLDEPFKTYPNGFPKEIMDEFEKRTGKKGIGNKPASGTKIIEELGEEHLRTKNPIVYTSADSVFQIAAHEEVIPIKELYEMCEIARDIMTGKHAVARIIARPFIGSLGSFERTANRRDLSLSPQEKTILDYTLDGGYDVIGIGKIDDIYNGQGISKKITSKSNLQGIDKTIEAIKENTQGIIFTNLVDFDSKFGHRRDTKGYKEALEEVNKHLPDLLNTLKETDVLIITADHGNDPTYQGTDHTREYVPLLIYGQTIKQGTDLGTRKSFSDIAATISDLLKIEKPKNGKSFADNILK
ncbi:phosphopentomutase [Isachenkonia alkalipeptolytica]|uniref:Phosphopentomutase n=1 Tax=Isachenkonia alkalipeptolytica TaxID=2565777 RepID=A0AA43XL84_9CLOT|nr:phosphopentomutase [Isachenkonia alkalipeptolytica]NBG88772.1 phosphopentomutase [Isachenkonia alkalipeptolytica]